LALNKSQLVFLPKLPSSRHWGDDVVLIYDRIFEKRGAAGSTAKWIRKFERRYAVKSGEKLKSLDQFPAHLKRILKLTEGLSTHQITVVVLGGGSVGDFGGFVASILKRGVRLVQIPSTWLSAVDSAHGGKTGLNVTKIKNQIGTFYSAYEIYLVRDLLESQPQIRALEALGEVLKIGLIEGRSLWNGLHPVGHISPKLYWKFLPQLIAAKYRVVKKDPFEKKGLRQVLNLGHTLGHVWESQLKISHGIAVLYGLAFAIEWSLHRKILSSKSYYQIRLSEFGSFLPDRIDLKKILRQTKNPKKFLLHDKKIAAGKKIRFIFLSAVGVPKAELVLFPEVLAEIKRQSR
jgi:3-dehydroquinate synthase